MSEWSDPQYRARYAEQYGPRAYNERAKLEAKANVIETYRGYDLSRVSSRFGPLVAIGSTGKAFRTVDECKTYIRENMA